MTDHGVDLDAVQAFLGGDEPLEDVTPVGGGTQNIMLRFRRGSGEFVLRRGPRHLRPRSNDALRREIVVLNALRDTDVACPRIVASCEDERVLGGAVFYVMEPVDGFNATVELPELHAGSAEIRHAMGPAAAAALATLHAVDHVAVGLGELGRPEGFLERQVGRWLSELESYNELDGYPGHELPAVDATAEWLQAGIPAQWTPGIVHGDYHVANLMYATDGPQVAAIVDWEMCTIGDPLLDLGWLLATWATPINPAGTVPTSELVAAYAARSTRSLEHLDWYTVLACFKLGIILEGTHARACAGKADKATGDQLHATAMALFGHAAQLTQGAAA